MTKKGRPKRERTEIISIRVPSNLKDFLKSLENRNQFFLDLIENSQEKKDYEKRKKSESNEPNLFSDLI